MIPLTLQEIARAVGGTIHGPANAMGDPGLTVTGPAIIDSREVTPGALFAAIVGARSDGHDFAAVAYTRRERGAGSPARRRAVRSSPTTWSPR